MRKYFHPQASFGGSSNIHKKEVLYYLEFELLKVQPCCFALSKEEQKRLACNAFIHDIIDTHYHAQHCSMSTQGHPSVTCTVKKQDQNRMKI